MSTTSEGSDQRAIEDGAAAEDTRNGSISPFPPIMVDDANNKKRTLMTHSKDGKLLTEKKLRRLEKNRISARECRRRKREATEHKLRQINMLEAENLRIRLQLEIGQEGEETALKQQSQIMQELDDLLTSGASEADIYEKIEEYKEKYADYGTSRRSSIESHLRQIERLLMPTQTTSVVMTAIQANPFDSTLADEGTHDSSTTSEPASVVPASLATDSLSTTSTNTEASAAKAPPDGMAVPDSRLQPKAFFHHLVNHLQVTPQQAAALKDSRFVARELDGCLEEALNVLQELRSRLAKTGDDLEHEFDQVRKILTPTQAAKFLVWVANNKACMHMLNELWDRVYPNENIFQDDKKEPAKSPPPANEE
jgi:hypothetical protein